MHVPQIQTVLAALVMQMEETHLTHFATVLLLVELAQVTHAAAITIAAMDFAHHHGRKGVFVQAVSVPLDTTVKVGVHLGDIATTIVLVRSYCLPIVKACFTFDRRIFRFSNSNPGTKTSMSINYDKNNYYNNKTNNNIDININSDNSNNNNRNKDYN